MKQIKSVYTIDYPKGANTFPNILHEKPEVNYG